MQQRRVKSESGFTLLELLIVIVVIGILALLIIPNLTSAPKKARDTDRKTDLSGIQKALEEYYLSYSVYPTSLSALTGTAPALLKTVPTDALNTGVYVYTYTASSPYSSYSLKACLENGGDTGKNTANDTSCAPSNRSYTLNNAN
jgi:type II secretion system protein G